MSGIMGTWTSTHGASFVPLVGPHQGIQDIIEGNYSEDGDGIECDAGNAAREIVEYVKDRYGIELT